jgi:hypothetical protein
MGGMTAMVDTFWVIFINLTGSFSVWLSVQAVAFAWIRG